ncbi:hypothetical protein CWI36_0003p0010 [Hamiltosporidium magnivora]|uniref:Sm domain-containing protein n=1 Tax=Hamiltosporidium magnivora TaxID=148818 RepID=A0A4Q9LMY9_9MICR|nr:hypothetical protein CWI36_0003p0010 [Hamiltosporidium magnivora]
MKIVSKNFIEFFPSNFYLNLNFIEFYFFKFLLEFYKILFEFFNPSKQKIMKIVLLLRKLKYQEVKIFTKENTIVEGQLKSIESNMNISLLGATITKGKHVTKAGLYNLRGTNVRFIELPENFIAESFCDFYEKNKNGEKKSKKKNKNKIDVPSNIKRRKSVNVCYYESRDARGTNTPKMVQKILNQKIKPPLFHKEEPTNNINKESDLEEETKVVEEVEENI